MINSQNSKKHWVIIGGGIIGTTIALALSKRKAGSIVVLEKEPSLGLHQSGRNSGVIHSGINQKPGSLKAKMCVEGSRLLREYCKKKRISMNECGTLVVARNNQESETLDRLLKMGGECGVEGLKLIGREDLVQREPAAKGNLALLSPTGATVDAAMLLGSLAQDARDAGVEYKLVHRVTGIEGNVIRTTQGDISAEHLVNCAGLHADKIAHMMGAGKQYKIIPFRGEYMEVRNCNVQSMIYQAPDLRFPFLSVHLTRETDGRVLAGPSAVLAFGREAYDKEWVASDMAAMFLSSQFLRMVIQPEFLQLALENLKTSLSKNSFIEQISSLIDGVRTDSVAPYRSGIRAQMVDQNGKLVDDILVERQASSTHVLNAVSPGMTCSLAFANYLTDQILN